MSNVFVMESGARPLAVRLLGAVSLGVASLGGCGSFWGGLVEFLCLKDTCLARSELAALRH